MAATKLKIDGMTCLNCVTHVQKSLEAVQGVTSATVTLDEGAVVEHQGVADKELLRAVEARGGYKAQIVP